MSSSSPTSVNDYLNSLDAAHLHVYSELTTALHAVIGDLPTATIAFIFPAGLARHPVHLDAAEVLWLAAQQLLFVSSHRPGEVPLLFLGYQATLRPAGQRHAIGFVLSNVRLIVRDDLAGIGGPPSPRSYELDPAPSEPVRAASLVARAWGRFSAHVERLAAPCIAADLQRTLTDAVAAVIRRNRELRHAPPHGRRSPGQGAARAGPPPAEHRPALVSCR